MSKIIVVFDMLCAQPDGESKFHGGGEYTKAVFKFFYDNYASECEIKACINKKLFIDDYLARIFNNNEVETIDTRNTKDIMEYLYSFDKKSEVNFFAGIIYAYKNVVFPDNVLAIGTSHGLRALEKPVDKYQLLYYDFLHRAISSSIKELVIFFLRRYSLKRYRKIYASALKSFKIIITVSQHSAYSLKINYPDIVASRDIYVFYSAPLNKFDVTEMTAHNKFMDDGFIMIVSANRWVKNSYRAVLALDHLYEGGFLAGIKTRVYGNMPKKIRKKIKNLNMFEFFGYVNSEELEEGYRCCKLLFYPTLNEGFGYVPLEAMKYGKTCVCAAVSSLPEIYQNSVYYCDPYDIMEMENRIMQAIEHKIDYNRIKEQEATIRDKQNKDLRMLCELISGISVQHENN